MYINRNFVDFKARISIQYFLHMLIFLNQVLGVGVLSLSTNCAEYQESWLEPWS